MTPEQLAKSGTEHGHQAALFCWCAANRNRFPELEWFHAIPNGGLRSKAQAGKLKAEGVKSGVCDTFLPVARRGYHGLYIEMKKPSERPKREGSKGGVSDSQAEFMKFAIAQRYIPFVCYSWVEAVGVLTWYLGEK